MTRKTSTFAPLLALILALAGGAAADAQSVLTAPDVALPPAADTFPAPPELEPDIAFWVSIFTHYDSDEGVLHDNRHLDVVYERLDIPASATRRDRQRMISDRRKALQRILRTLAGGKRDKLSAEEARVLALWPENVGNDTLRAAVNRIRYQQGLADRFRDGLARSGRWRSYIEAELRANGVPLALAALPHVESSYNPDARSHVGASGIWQFTRSTGRRYMRVDHVLDERNDPFAATRGAARLLAYNYSITGNWPMAITAYNHGLAGVRRAMRQYGDTAYVDILRKYNGRTFGFASRNFYVAFLAAARVDQDPERYFPGVTREAEIAYDEAELSAYLPASELSRVFGVSARELSRHNPALQATVWQGSKHVPKGFSVRLPKGVAPAPLAELLAGVPAERWSAKQLPDMFHTVARGDTLSQIAEHYDTRVSTLVALNNLSSQHRIRAGQRLRLPAAGPAPAPSQPPARAPAEQPPEPPPVVAAAAVAAEVAEIEAVAEDAEMDEIVVTAAVPVAMATEPEPPAGEQEVQTALLSDPSDYSVSDDLTIEVQSLETLGHFADWLGIRTQRLRDINGLAFRTPVEVGQRIKLEFRDVDQQTFEARRIEYHRSQQDRYFRENVIAGVSEHVIRRGESVWVLSLREYGVPIWLFRQYNPELDLHRIRPGMTVRFPQLVAGDRS
ncbi:MAG: LysM peptidoglycan-binding domain-containing protein [Woeseiaceae bacterium]|nr:LysM peptidoglycan-binding domain-containing protein [Woeseiaceae bacterium]